MQTQDSKSWTAIYGHDFVVFAVVAFYFVTSISLVLLNKFMFSSDSIEIDAPLFLTWTQIVIAVMCCFIFSKLNKTVSSLSFFPNFEYDLSLAVKISPLTFIFIGMIVFNNLCLKYVAVSFYQVARALTIVFNVIFTFVVLREGTSRKALACCAVVVFGYALGVDGEVEFSVHGVVYGLASSLFVCLYSIYVKHKLPVLDNNEWRLMIYNNLNAFFMMPFVIFIGGEVPEIMKSPALYQSYFWWITVVTGLFGFLINISTFLQIKYTSPLTHNVSGTAKACVQSILGVMIWKNKVSFKAGVGTLMSIFGCALYAYVRSLERGPAKQPAPMPPAASKADTELTAVAVEGSKDTKENR